MSHLPETLVTFVKVLAEDGDLRAWFESFRETPDVERAVEFRKLAAQMQAAGEAPELITATALLADAKVYRTAEVALQQASER